MILRFTVETFDPKILAAMQSDDSRPDVLIKKLALYIGSFLMPKYVIKGLLLNDSSKVVLKNSMTGRLSITNKNSGLLKSLRQQGVEVKDIDIYGPQFTQDIAVRTEWQSYSVYEISNDFFGVLPEMDSKQKKIEVLDVYKLMFRFSIGKLIKYMSKPEFICVVL